MKITKLTKRSISEPVYNFHCLPNENYFSAGMLVHNCYKSNAKDGKFMTIDTFKQVVNKLPKYRTDDGREVCLVNQIALGADAECKTNPDIWLIMDYCQSVGITPNITVANIDDATADKLAHFCGAVAVSRYDNKEICYATIKKLADRGMDQVNIHQLVAEETYDNIIETIKDVHTDPRLEGLNAIVLLNLKPKGRGTNLHSLAPEKYREIISLCFSEHIDFGSDSCGADKLLKSVDAPVRERIATYVEPCESTRMSLYINVDGKAFPCSFMDGEAGWEEGIDMLKVNDFMAEVWNAPRTVEFRNRVIACNKAQCGGCCHYQV